MKFENVSKLIDMVTSTLGEMDCFWRSSKHGESLKETGSGTRASTSKNGVMSMQTGALRVSCLDCLDRTNVVQSALGRHMLYVQLARVGLARTSEKNKDEKFDFAFNDMWANNGDQVSQCYAGSRALKGDFTRTGRRNWAGMFNDATASVYRMVQGAVSDFWRQAVISFVYGELSLKGLEKYADELQTVDPSNETRLAKIRAAAIETSASMVLPQGEALVGGWTLFAPAKCNAVQSSKLEEKVLLLTPRAIYICAFDFTAGKLSEYSRVLLRDITGLQKGLYVISPHEGHHPEQHWGLIVSFLKEATRVNVGSVENVPARDSNSSGTNFVAFKAIAHEFVGTLDWHDGRATLTSRYKEEAYADRDATLRSNITRESLLDHRDDETMSSKRIVDVIAVMLLEECANVGAYDPSADDAERFVIEKSIQSLAEAKAQAPFFAEILEGLKRRVWL